MVGKKKFNTFPIKCSKGHELLYIVKGKKNSRFVSCPECGETIDVSKFLPDSLDDTIIKKKMSIINVYRLEQV